jgi:allantoin racemase
MAKILIINPNTTASMTDKIHQAALAVAHPQTVIETVNPESGPVSIEGHYDEAFSVPGLLGCIRRGERQGYSGYVIACFDDSGLGAAREIATGPVVGIGEAAMHFATLLGTGFSIITTLARSVPILEDNAERYGFGRRCRRVRAASVPVLALEQPGSDARVKVKAEAQRALAEDGSDCIVLGCAGMADLVRWLSSELGVPVIDGVAAAVKLVESLSALNLHTSKSGAYAYPGAKDYRGDFAHYQPGED